MASGVIKGFRRAFGRTVIELLFGCYFVRTFSGKVGEVHDAWASRPAHVR